MERTFAWLVRFRRMARAYERLPEMRTRLHFLTFAILLLSGFIRFMTESA